MSELSELTPQLSAENHHINHTFDISWPLDCKTHSCSIHTSCSIYGSSASMLHVGQWHKSKKTVGQRQIVDIPGQTKQAYAQELKAISKDTQRAPKLVPLFFISCLLLTPPYLFCAFCWVCCTLQPGLNEPFLKKHNICFFWWRLHKSESFISRQHTSSKTPGRILLFLSNHFLSIFWCQDPSWLTSAGSIWVPYQPLFPMFCHAPDW